MTDSPVARRVTPDELLRAAGLAPAEAHQLYAALLLGPRAASSEPESEFVDLGEVQASSPRRSGRPSLPSEASSLARGDAAILHCHWLSLAVIA